MKKIGIITIPDYNNYGNRLQNFAVKRIFEKIGYYVDTLELNDIDFKNYKERKFKLWLKANKFFRLVYLFIWFKEGLLKARRDQFFEEFTSRFLSVRYEPLYNQKTINNIKSEYSYFVLGSDQIWHPNINVTPNLFFGKFANEEQIICFAPSLGITNISESYMNILKYNLNKINKISIREIEGSKIIKQIIGKDVPVLIDPTMMLDAEEWIELAKCPKNKPKHKYILNCFLGYQNNKYINFIDDLSITLGLSIFHLSQPDYKQGYLTGPSEFLWYILNSEIVCTDSFHTIVFSILFKKPFIAFPRLTNKDLNCGLDSRIDTLLNKFGLEKRKFKYIDQNSILTCDFSEIYPILEKERKIVNDFLADLV
jgi:hypothetical protein